MSLSTPSKTTTQPKTHTEPPITPKKSSDIPIAPWDQIIMSSISTLLYQACYKPQELLGCFTNDQTSVHRVYAGKVQRVSLLGTHDEILVDLHPIPNEIGQASGIWSIQTHAIPAQKYTRYYVEDMDHNTWIMHDPYVFKHPLSHDQLQRFQQGNHHRIHEFLGAHPHTLLGVKGVSFCVWAPNASRVNIIGEFNGWDEVKSPMMRVYSQGEDYGLWWIFIPEAVVGHRYQFAIKNAAGHILPYKADPMAFASELAPARASIVIDQSEYEWHDQTWMQHRQAYHQLGQPMSTYEIHAGSWRTHADGTPLNYRQLANLLVPYVKALGFTHIEFMPLTEYPFEGSWGYQTLGLFAPTCRYGSADDLRFLIDTCHQANIGVILDWVPGHFPLDEHGLACFDGSHLYEHADPRRGLHPDWGTALYQYGRLEVQDFLISSALFWLEHFHFDGIRVDAVASMLYLDYSRKPNEWIPNEFGGREHLEAITFLKKLNEVAYGYDAGIMMIAEESTSWPKVSAPTYEGGLGFGRKWNMGWMNDTLRYIEADPVHRRWEHHLATFSMVYAYNEFFILPISHDEVVHGKGSLWNKMPGDDWQKLAQLKLYLSFMWTHPGQKLLFMGSEFAQDLEWSHQKSLSWHHLNLKDQEEPDFILQILTQRDQHWEDTQTNHHWSVLRTIQTLNYLYREVPALHQMDHQEEGFTWLLVDDQERSILSFMRKAIKTDGSWGDVAVVVLNFTPIPRLQERIGVVAGEYELVLNTDQSSYGGSNIGYDCLTHIQSEAHAWQGQAHSIVMDIPPMAACILVLQRGID